MFNVNIIDSPWRTNTHILLNKQVLIAGLEILSQTEGGNAGVISPSFWALNKSMGINKRISNLLLPFH